MISLYYEVGVVGKAHSLATSLDIKQIQLDTLSYIYMDHVEYFFAEKNKNMVTKTLSIYDRNRLETSEMICQAFKFESWSRVPEFLDFKKRLDCSIQQVNSMIQFFKISIHSCSSYSSVLEFINNFDCEFFTAIGFYF